MSTSPNFDAYLEKRLEEPDVRAGFDAEAAEPDVYTQDEQGNWVPAVPIGWREEHNIIQRLALWLLRRPHCRDGEARP